MKPRLAKKFAQAFADTDDIPRLIVIWMHCGNITEFRETKRTVGFKMKDGSVFKITSVPTKRQSYYK